MMEYVSDIDMIKFVRKLNNINRCSMYPVIRATSVAEHSFHVGAMSALISQEFLALGVYLDQLKVIQLALFHDVEESAISDIPHHVKTALRELAPQFDEVCHSVISQVTQKYPPYFKSLVQAGCDGSLEWLIVKLCDSYELLCYCLEEYNMGNKQIRDILTNSDVLVTQYLRLIRKHLREIYTISWTTFTDCESLKIILRSHQEAESVRIS